VLKKLNGTVKQLVCTDTWQFDDYSKYETSNFDVEKKKKTRATTFPKDCERAYEIGRKITDIHKDGRHEE
jgi:hypothetical protein